MGFDITFHPIGLDEIKYYLFEVVENPSLAESRVHELTSKPEVREFLLRGFYSKFDEWLAEIQADGQVSPVFSARFAFWAAQISGFLHPFWYARGSALSFVAEESKELKAVITSLTKLTDGKLKDLSDMSEGLITENYKGGGYISDLKALTAVLDIISKPKGWEILSNGGWNGNDSLLEKYFDDEGIDSLSRAIRYAQDNNLGLMEAADVCGPSGCYTEYENMKAHYLGNIDK